MAVPVDADACVGKSLVTAIERHVILDLALILFHELFGPDQCRLFFGGKDENKISLCFHCRVIQSAYRGQQGFDVARVVAYTRRVNSPLANLSVDLPSSSY